MSARRSPGPDALSRRRFVALVAAGSASVLAPAVSGAAAAKKSAAKPAAKAPPAAPAPAKPATPSAEQKEFDRQRASTQATLKTLREYALPPGGDLAVVFRPLHQPKKGR